MKKKDNKKKRVLILSCGVGSVYHIVKILKEKYSDYFYIVGADINESFLIPSINLLDTFYKVSLSIENNFYEEILSILDKEDIDIIIPILDYDQFLFCKDNKDLVKRKIISTAPDKSVFDFYGDKEKMNFFLRKNGFLVPKQFQVSEVKSEDKYFIKIRNGVGSVGATQMIGSDILSLKNLDRYIIEEVCFDPEITVEVFNIKNKISYILRERIETKAGVCTKSCIFFDKNMQKTIEKFCKIILVPNVFNIQFMKNKNGDYVITDVNFRFAGGMSLSYKVGWDEVSALADMWLGKTNGQVFSNFSFNNKKQWVVRIYNEIITKQE